ncbi:membrane hypothetical protein [Frankia canadensis]|uniref:Uncharacterized protein n=1 Tax=Frankia canadensis TaxID=1836972 RepID=A0A2I2KS18_9ACTN|nr:hypothetical protein [Frankia canadensis]SNQ48467.1 membrane hypothetical protein [Frankia canadensis]SOU55757.1 membrane hypothetical protein [Frankia canadensis]
MARKAAELITYAFFVVKFDLLSLGDYVENAVARWVTLFFLSAGLLVLVLTTVLVAVDRDQRRAAGSAMALPFGVMLAATTPFLGTWAAEKMLDLNRLAASFPILIAMILGLLGLALYVVLFFASLAALFVSAHTFFFAGTAHPLLPPLLTVVTVWILVGCDITGIQDRVVTALFDKATLAQSTASLAFGITSAVVATAFAALEIRQLHANGIHLRAGPWR